MAQFSTDLNPSQAEKICVYFCKNKKSKKNSFKE